MFHNYPLPPPKILVFVPAESQLASSESRQPNPVPPRPYRAVVTTPAILLADDDRDMHEIGAAIFAQAGFRVLHVYRGDEVLPAMRTDPPCLLILDVHLPVMDGLEVATALASDSRTASVPILILTADTQVHAQHPELARRVAGWLVKPCLPRELLAKVQELTSIQP